MITRGVASIRSPVKNLQEFSPTVTHDKFVRAMVQAFREEYHVGELVRPPHKDISLSFSSSLLPSSGPGATRASGGCDRHTIHPKQHGQFPCRTPHIRIVDVINDYFIFQEWDWVFGQTPEFTYSISRSFGWGNVVSLQTRSVCMLA